MAKLQAKKILSALKKAQNVGQVEEPTTIAGCKLVLRSLRPEEYEAALAEVSDLNDLEYLNAYRKGHLSRSICEINGESLREYDFIEVDVEEKDPKTGRDVVKTINVETHAFVADYVISTWSREAIDVAFRKFDEVVSLSEKVASEGVEFRVPDETPDEKYRRLLTEARELEGQIPFELATQILDQVGYLPKASKAELDSAENKLAQVAKDLPQEDLPSFSEAEVKESSPVEEKGLSDTSQSEVVSQAPPVSRPMRQDSAQPDPEVLMRMRRPLNKLASDVPAPVPTPQATQPVQPPPAMQANPVIPITPSALRRAQEIEKMEKEAGDLDLPPAVQGGVRLTDGIPELSQNMAKVNPKAAESILDQPPSAGINPRYRPQQKL